MRGANGEWKKKQEKKERGYLKWAKIKIKILWDDAEKGDFQREIEIGGILERQQKDVKVGGGGVGGVKGKDGGKGKEKW